MLTAASNSYQKAADDAAVALLRGIASKANAHADTVKPDATSNRGPATRTSLSAPAPAISLLRASLNALQPALDNDVADALSDQLQETSDTLTKLDQARQGMIGDRKAAAEQKLELARKKLALLRALGGDPKTIARQAKAIAQEIKAAAIAYGEALKAEGASGSTTDVSADAALSSTDPAAVTTDPAAAGDKAAIASNDETTTKADTSDAGAVQPQDAVGTAKAETKDNAHDHDVLEAFKEAAREVKRLLQEAARKLKAQQAADPDADGALKAGAAMDKAIEDLEDIMQTGQSSGGASIADIPIAVPPTIDIQV